VRALALTRGDRDRTALLLRCAAEAAVTGSYVIGPGWTTASRLGFRKDVRKRTCRLATRAAQHVARSTGRDPDKAPDLAEYLVVVLEAALRVEGGS